MAYLPNRENPILSKQHNDRNEESRIVRTLIKMKCLHEEPCAHSTTQKESLWFCNQNPNCNFVCSVDDSYLFEKAIMAGRSTKQPHPCCEKHSKLRKMHVHVVKDFNET